MGIYTVRVREVIPTGTIPPKKNPRKRFEKIKNKKKSWKKLGKSRKKVKKCKKWDKFGIGTNQYH
jgi:hypothetical protein